MKIQSRIKEIFFLSIILSSFNSSGVVEAQISQSDNVSILFSVGLDIKTNEVDRFCILPMDRIRQLTATVSNCFQNKPSGLQSWSENAPHETFTDLAYSGAVFIFDLDLNWSQHTNSQIRDEINHFILLAAKEFQNPNLYFANNSHQKKVNETVLFELKKIIQTVFLMFVGTVNAQPLRHLAEEAISHGKSLYKLLKLKVPSLLGEIENSISHAKSVFGELAQTTVLKMSDDMARILREAAQASGASAMGTSSVSASLGKNANVIIVRMSRL